MPLQNKTKIAFFGTPEFAVSVLGELEIGGIIPDLIITNPDEPKGRRLKITPPPVRIWANARKILTIQPENLRAIPDALKQEFDLFVVVAYGKIIPETVLNIARHGTINVHPSLLPKYRGPSPIQATILNGDEVTGVSIMLLDKEMDHGPIIAQEVIDIRTWHPYIYELRERLAKIAGQMLIKIIPDWIAGKINATEQDHSGATFTKKTNKDDGFVDSKIVLGEDHSDTNQAREVWRKVRALTPDPGVYTILEIGKKKTRLKITRAKFENEKLIIEKVVPEGKKEMSFEDWKRGNFR